MQNQKKSRGLPLRVLISCWIALPGSMLTVSPLATAWGSKQSSLISARSAQNWNTTLEDVKVSLLTAGCFSPSPLCCCHRSWQLSVFVLSLSLAHFYKIPVSRETGRKEHTSLLAFSHHSLMLSCFILMVFHREVPQPIIVTLHYYITTVHVAGFKQPMQCKTQWLFWLRDRGWTWKSHTRFIYVKV